MFGRFGYAARVQQLGISGLSLSLVAAATIVGSGVIAPTSAGADCAAPPVTTLSLAAVNGRPPSTGRNAAIVTTADTLTYRLRAVSGCHTNTPFTLALAVPTPVGTTYSGQREGWVFGINAPAGTGTQHVTVPGRGSITKQFTVRVDASSGHKAITATAVAGAGACQCLVTANVTGPTVTPDPVGATASATITLVDSVAGRTVPTDQFALKLSDPAALDDPALGSIATVATQTSASTKPITIDAGRPYEIDAATVAGSPSQLADYTTSISCSDAGGAAVATVGTAPAWTVTAVADATMTCSVSEVPPSLDCASGTTLFGLSPVGPGTQIVTSDIASGQSTSIGPVYPTHAAGLGVTADGSRAYLVDGDGTVLVYSAATGAFTELLDSGIAGVTVGAVDPANGAYYFGTADTLYEYDAASNTVGPVGALDSMPTGLAFDRTGHGYLTSGGVLSTFVVPGAEQSAALVTSPLTSGLPAATRGLAFGTDGNLYLASGVGVRGFDPTTGATVGAANAGALTDLTGCASPYLIAVTTSQPAGTVATTDQFSAALSGGSIPGASTGPLLATPGPSYTLTETMPSGDPTTYTITWSCIDSISGSTIAAGAGPSGAFTLGRTPAGGDVSCTFVNAAFTPAALHTTTNLVSVNGGAIPATGVTTGDVLTYQISVGNSGQLPGSTTVHEQIPAGTSYSGTGEGWTLANGGADLELVIEPGATVTATFTVTVGRLSPGTRTIDERASASSGDCGRCSISTPTAAVLATTLTLVAVNGTPVAPGQTLGPGDVLQYRFVLSNSGGTSGSTVITESVPANTSYTGASTEGWSIDGPTATRSLTAPASGSAAATFTVTVDNPLQIGTTEITNSGSASVGSCACTVTAAVPAYAAAITASTSRVHLGDTVTYTVLVRNNGTVDYTADNPAVVTDDLSGVLDDAGYNNDASRGGLLSGNVITWQLSLPSGTLIALTFTVTINAPDSGDKRLLDSIATPVGTGGNCPPGSKDPDCVANTVGLLIYTTTLTGSTKIAHPGDVVTYTVTVANTGSLAYTAAEPARFSVDLAGVIDDATYQNDATGAPAISGSVLSWALGVPAGGNVAVTFTVLIARPDTGDNRLPLTVRSPAGLGGNCVIGPPSTACDPGTVVVSAFMVTMAASASTVRPGQKVTYTVHAANVGGVDYTAADPAIVAVDLSGLLDDANYGSDANNGATYGQPTIMWHTALPIGVTRSFSFSMVLKAAGSGDGSLLGLLVTSVGGNCPVGSSGPVCAPEPAALQAYTTAISTDRSAATNGGTVTYQVTVKNAGTVAYSATDPARFGNDVQGVLDDASFDGELSTPATFSGTTISWKSALPVGATMILTYSVTVASPDAGNGILTSAVVTPAGLGGDCGPRSVSKGCASEVLISSLSLVTRATPVTMRDPGDVISYAFTVTNTGHLPVTGVHLIPVNFSGTSASPNLAGCGVGLGALAVGASRTCELTYSVSAADIDAGVITHAAIARGSDQINPVVASNQSTGLVTLVAPITLSMRAVTTDVNGDGVIDAGDRVDWTISATDTGTSAVTGLSVSDSLLGPASCGLTELQRDAVTDCTAATYTIRDSDANSALVDTAFASGMQVNGAEIGALQTTYVLQVLSPPPVSTNVRTSATARLALIVFITLLALGGLFLIAGWRSSRRRVRRP